MSIAKKMDARMGRPEQALDPNMFSRCHNAAVLSADVLLLNRDGSTLRVGRMRYCFHDKWFNGRHEECYAPQSVRRFRNWPDGLSDEEAIKVCNHIGPEYWLSSAFHMFQWQGKWCSLRSMSKSGGITPWMRRDFDSLTDSAKRLVRGLMKAHSSGKMSDVFSIDSLDVRSKRTPYTGFQNAGVAAAAAHAKGEQLVRDRKAEAAGDVQRDDEPPQPDLTNAEPPSLEEFFNAD